MSDESCGLQSAGKWYVEHLHLTTFEEERGNSSTRPDPRGRGSASMAFSDKDDNSGGLCARCASYRSPGSLQLQRERE